MQRIAWSIFEQRIVSLTLTIIYLFICSLKMQAKKEVTREFLIGDTFVSFKFRDAHLLQVPNASVSPRSKHTFFKGDTFVLFNLVISGPSGDLKIVSGKCVWKMRKTHTTV